MTDELNGGAFDLERIRSLIDLMIEHELGEIDLRNAEHRIRLRRGGAPVPSIAPIAAPSVPAPAAPTSDSSAEDEGQFVYVNSPMVGTFYSKPNPEAPPYIKLGDYVDKDTTVCIVEAMKVMNEIQAEVSGRVVAVLVEDEEPVDVGKPLFKIEISS